MSARSSPHFTIAQVLLLRFSLLRSTSVKARYSGTPCHWSERVKRRGGVFGHTRGQDTVDAETQIGMLFRAAQRQDRAVILLEVFLDLRPIHFGNAHVDPWFLKLIWE